MSNRSESVDLYLKTIQDHAMVVEQLKSQQELFANIAEHLIRAIRDGKKILWCGNGGSAADSQHLAAELVGRFRRERRAWCSIALTTDTSILTSVANDASFDDLFERQLLAIGRQGDVVLAISTSGNSPNVLQAVCAAGEKGMKTIGLTGKGGGELAGICSLSLIVDSDSTQRIQETHITIGHILCELIENALYPA